jgi:hypothetical protein
MRSAIAGARDGWRAVVKLALAKAACHVAFSLPHARVGMEGPRLAEVGQGADP